MLRKRDRTENVPRCSGSLEYAHQTAKKRWERSELENIHGLRSSTLGKSRSRNDNNRSIAHINSVYHTIQFV